MEPTKSYNSVILLKKLKSYIQEKNVTTRCSTLREMSCYLPLQAKHICFSTVQYHNIGQRVSVRPFVLCPLSVRPSVRPSAVPFRSPDIENPKFGVLDVMGLFSMFAGNIPAPRAARPFTGRLPSFLPSPLQLAGALERPLRVVAALPCCQASYPLVANNVRLLCDEAEGGTSALSAMCLASGGPPEATGLLSHCVLPAAAPHATRNTWDLDSCGAARTVPLSGTAVKASVAFSVVVTSTCSTRPGSRDGPQLPQL